MGCVCYENTDMGLYFICDPDGYGSKYYLYRYIETEHTSPGFPKIR